ncbi:hypothetical protein KUCAC02_011096 [Chaenocephalus aceratus]|uniref:Uncharacterized protein n=1 Tax=Chaenocephalus aceratus TaxID=36190 RepID=A0ACB9WVW6_CHAAC|nr:hypothetical protein KUCAC02_011096 [Chaenocephalus aceratus]
MGLASSGVFSKRLVGLPCAGTDVPLPCSSSTHSWKELLGHIHIASTDLDADSKAGALLRIYNQSQRGVHYATSATTQTWMLTPRLEFY